MTFLLLALLRAALAAPLDCAALANDVAAAPDSAGRSAVIGAAVGVAAGDAQSSAALGRMLSALPQAEGQSTDSARAILFGACVGAVTAPPQPAPPPPAPPAPPSKLPQLREYERQHLERGSLQSVGAYTTVAPAGNASIATTNLYTVNTWTVYDGGGQPLTALMFADQVGDYAGRARVEQKVKAFRTGGVVSTLAGAVLAAVGYKALVNDQSGGPVAFVAGAAGLGTGLGLLISVPMVKAAPVARHYTAPQADTLVEAYNSKLRQELKLTPEDTASIDLR